jgi:hypothetical protein
LLKLYWVHSRFFTLWKTNQNNTFVPQGKEKTRGENTTGFINIGKNKNTPEMGV